MTTQEASTRGQQRSCRGGWANWGYRWFMSESLEQCINRHGKTRIFSLDCGEAPLRKAHSNRTEFWWQAINALMPSWKHRKIDAQYGKAGRQNSKCEKPFVDAWGECWRNNLEDVVKLSELMARSREFFGAVARDWKFLGFKIDTQMIPLKSQG